MTVTSMLKSASRAVLIGGPFDGKAMAIPEMGYLGGVDLRLPIVPGSTLQMWTLGQDEPEHIVRPRGVEIAVYRQIRWPSHEDKVVTEPHPMGHSMVSRLDRGPVPDTDCALFLFLTTEEPS